jgi:hypothetical protein
MGVRQRVNQSIGLYQPEIVSQYEIAGTVSPQSYDLIGRPTPPSPARTPQMPAPSTLLALVLGFGMYFVGPIVTKFEPFSAASVQAQTSNDDGVYSDDGGSDQDYGDDPDHHENSDPGEEGDGGSGDDHDDGPDDSDPDGGDDSSDDIEV